MSKAVSAEKGVTVKDETSIMGPLRIKLAELVDTSVEVSELVGLPEGFEGGETYGGLPASPRFVNKGDAAFGTFIRVKEDVGPNHSRVYELDCPMGNGETKKIAVWGSTDIDSQFDGAFPPVQPGDRIGFVFLGEKKTARNQNPLKRYTMYLKRMTI